jgi:hypothetical protein
MVESGLIEQRCLSWLRLRFPDPRPVRIVSVTECCGTGLRCGCEGGSSLLKMMRCRVAGYGPGGAEFTPNTTGPERNPERNNVMPNLHYEVLLDDACAHPRPAPFGR